ncbi:MAG: DUF2809 domain-containing protein [Dysgonamonadaceae bacterium]|jgi:hypothetical protein|nr:DUF2809 domain-containing protein [Dysgonamonadaceae bacterium]
MANKRLFYLSCTVALFVIELLIALYVHDTIIRPYIGDVLVTILVYVCVRIVFPYGIRLLPLYVFIFACGIEFIQYLQIIEVLGLSGNVIARTVIGTSFSWIDILCYGAGCLVCLFDRYLYRLAGDK